MPHPGGRPRVFTQEIVLQIEILRREGAIWSEVGNRLGLRPQSCRRAWWEARKAQRGVGNSPADQRPAAPEA